MHIATMISSQPHVQGNLNEAFVRAIEEANACAAICRICADPCLGEAMMADLVQCIRIDLDCADVCAATGMIGARRTGSNEAVIKRMHEVCAETCAACATECEGHAEMHEHCRICAEACRRCADAWLQGAETITPKD